MEVKTEQEDVKQKKKDAEEKFDVKQEKEDEKVTKKAKRKVKQEPEAPVKIIEKQEELVTKPTGNFGMFKSNESSLFGKDEDKIKSVKKDKSNSASTLNQPQSCTQVNHMISQAAALDKPFSIKELKDLVTKLAKEDAKLNVGSFMPLRRRLHPVVDTPLSRKRRRVAFESLKRQSKAIQKERMDGLPNDDDDDNIVDRVEKMDVGRKRAKLNSPLTL